MIWLGETLAAKLPASMIVYPTKTAASLLAFALLLSGCQQEATERSDDILLVTIDTLRSDFVSAYGYPRKSTPNLDALAEQGALFERHFTTIATTAPAHATMFTGLYAREHGLTKNGQLLGSELPNLPEILNDRGYRTGASIGARILGSKHGFARGFESFDEDFGPTVLRPAGKSGKYERYAESVIDRAIGILEQPDERPLFLWVHLYDPHDPYQPPQPSPLHPERELNFFRKRAEPSAEYNRDILSKMLAGYEAELTYVDGQFGRLLTAWESRATGPDSLVIVTSDHGEGLGEHRYQGHGFLLYEEQVNIPLIIRYQPVIESGLRIASTTSTIDLPATILELIGIGNLPEIKGRSLISLSGASMRNRDAFAERRHFKDTDLQRSDALRKLIKNFARQPIGSVGEKCILVRENWKFVWNDNGRHELFDLAADPREEHNLYADKPERASEMQSAIEQWRKKDSVHSSAVGAEAHADTETEEMLDALGY
ncbi:MAG: arylsulfatase A-like enzyme [Planctomycetota bacterium]